MTAQRKTHHEELDERTEPAEGNEAFECSFEEAIALYYGEWVLFKILEFDEDWEPVRGLVVAHSPSRAAISEAFAREPPRSAIPADAPYQPYYTFNAFPRLRIGETLEEGKTRFAEQRAAALEVLGARGK